MAKLDISAISERKGSNYPAPFAKVAGERVRQALGSAGGLSDFGVNLTRLPPGSWSSQRHWHSSEDELVYVLSGELMLITDDGERPLCAGDCAAFPKNVANGHHLINRSTQTATFLEIGTRSVTDTCHYPDIDLLFDPSIDGYSHNDGRPYC